MTSKKKKRRARPAPKEDRSIRVSGDISGQNTTFVSGDFATVSNTVNMPEPKPINVQPYTDNDLLLIRIGKWLMGAIYGTQNHGLGLFGLVTVILNLVFGGITFYPYVDPNNPFYTIRSPSFLILELAALLGFVVAFSLGSTVLWGYHTQCPKCSWKFSKMI